MGGRRIFLLGASGTIGQATASALTARGHEVVALVRSAPGLSPEAAAVRQRLRAMPGLILREGNPLSGESLRRDGLQGERFDTWVSCLASRTGAPADAWAVDHAAHVQALQACREAGVQQVVLLSALCVQKPRLAFQQAKLAFESALIESGLNHSIVRPTAFFKSLSGQVQRLRQGRPFLLFGDGSLTACKPIADEDLGAYLAQCVDDAALHRRVLPIGGPGPALTPREQGHLLFEALARKPHFKQVPVAMMDAIVAALALAGAVWPSAAAKAELARIGRYYATESMLVWDPVRSRYSAEDTPEFGQRTLAEHYRALARGEVADQRGDHAVF
ncbi:MAG: NAD(P)H-binding protein [Betaproteobacteria bacterium]